MFNIRRGVHNILGAFLQMQQHDIQSLVIMSNVLDFMINDGLLPTLPPNDNNVTLIERVNFFYYNGIVMTENDDRTAVQILENT